MNTNERLKRFSWLLVVSFSSTEKAHLGRVRLTLFRNKNTWSDDENGMFGAFQSSKDNKNMFKIAFLQKFDNFNVNLRKNKGF